MSIEEWNIEIDKAEDEIKNGNFLTHKQAIAEINKWQSVKGLNKKIKKNGKCYSECKQ
jgi:predicted transcriptional regulator